MKKAFIHLLILVFLSKNAVTQPTSGLVAYWPMNGNFTDAGSNAINGTNFNATSTTNQYGSAGKAMLFTNPGSVVQYATHPINSNLSFTAAQDFTISFSFLLSSPWVQTGGFYDNCVNYGGYGIFVWNVGSPSYKIQFNFRNATLASSALTLNTWYRICAVRSGSSLKIYLNGVLDATGTVGTMTPAYNFAGRFGTMFYDAQTPKEYNGLNGKMDEFRIYNRALTDAEITQIATLPIKLTSFMANRKESDVLIQWTTHHEENSSHFNVQRSNNGSDFTTISRIQAKGSQSVSSDYQFTDVNPQNSNGNIYYRLESVDKDGRAEFSNIIVVKTQPGKNFFSLLENPVKDDLRLRFSVEKASNIELRLMDFMGRTISSKQIKLNTGETFTSIPVNHLEKGSYLVTTITEGRKETLRFIKQ